jgi:L-glyceraldehyde 3-phosphate reductase
MWPGPYGEWGSRKYLVASLDQSLKRMGLDYVDIFYSHRPDPDTPLEETMQALDQVVRQGKALYAGISSYTAEQTQAAADILRELGTPCLIHQPNYSMFSRWIEDGLQDVLDQYGIGSIAFCPLAQGMLTPKYLSGIPQDSRAGKAHGHLQVNEVTTRRVQQARELQDVAIARGQTLPQLALAWVLRGEKVTSALIGASSPQQVVENVRSLENLEFTAEELDRIDKILSE